MSRPHIDCVLQGSGDPIFRAANLDYQLVEGGLFRHTVGGVTTNYKVESAVLEVEAMTGDPETTTAWKQYVLRVIASIVP